MDARPDPDVVATTVARARDALASGRGGGRLEAALEQLVADRTNGESGDAAHQRVLDELDGVNDAERRYGADESPA